MAVAKVIEVSAGSTESFEDAIRSGLAKAGATATAPVVRARKHPRRTRAAVGALPSLTPPTPGILKGRVGRRVCASRRSSLGGGGSGRACVSTGWGRRGGVRAFVMFGAYRIGAGSLRSSHALVAAGLARPATRAGHATLVRKQLGERGEGAYRRRETRAPLCPPVAGFALYAGVMSKRSRVLAFGSTALLVVAGAVSAAMVGDGTGAVLAVALIGGGLVVATGLTFLEVGLSEDRGRAREARRRRSRTPKRPEPRRLPRMRGRPRRLD
jgi:hypothetical protein